MKTFLQNIAFFIYVYIPAIVIFSSLCLFFIKDKHRYLKLTTFILNLILTIVIFLTISIIFYPNGDDRFGYMFEIFFLLTSSLIFTILFVINIYFNYKKCTYKNSYLNYFKIKYKYIIKSFLKTLISIFLTFQFFLIWSAFNAYEKAKELGYIGHGYSIILFYSPFVKTIVFNKKRYSYHRAKYVDLRE